MLKVLVAALALIVAGAGAGAAKAAGVGFRSTANCGLSDDGEFIECRTTGGNCGVP